MSVSLLSTKFYVPRIRGNNISRPHLIDLLNEGLQRRLTLISAPAGFGKTTLLGEWHNSEWAKQFKTAWLSLDNDDNNSSRFLVYLAASVGRNQLGIGKPVLAATQSPQVPPFNLLRTDLINDLCTLGTSSVLVLDDYHVITSQAVHEVAMFLLDHPREQMHLVIVTRSDPPLPFARLRANGQLTEIRANEFRFTFEETSAFLQRVTNPSLSPEDIFALDGRTEGWIAGLQMAGLSLHSYTDTSQFIKAFSGSNRYILDYLAEDVLNRQSAEVQQFLLRTSIIARSDFRAGLFYTRFCFLALAMASEVKCCQMD